MVFEFVIGLRRKWSEGRAGAVNCRQRGTRVVPHNIQSYISVEGSITMNSVIYNYTTILYYYYYKLNPSIPAMYEGQVSMYGP